MSAQPGNPLYDRVAGILVDRFGVNGEDISPEASFEDLDLDSLDLVEFSTVCEDELGVRIEDEEADQLKTFGDAVSLLDRKGATAG